MRYQHKFTTAVLCSWKTIRFRAIAFMDIRQRTSCDKTGDQYYMYCHSIVLCSSVYQLSEQHTIVYLGVETSECSNKWFIAGHGIDTVW
jgi:hypothetical protein